MKLASVFFTASESIFAIYRKYNSSNERKFVQMG